MSEECTFTVHIRDLKATELKSRQRFREEVKIKMLFDDIKIKTEKEEIGGGAVTWKYSHKFDYKIPSWQFLEERLFKLRLVALPDTKTSIGHLSIDLYTLATGPTEHNLPIVDFEGKPVGRLSFIIEMEQISDIVCMFKHISVKGLTSPDPKRPVSAYLKYAYSKMWNKIQENSFKYRATYSHVVPNTSNPVFTDIPSLSFRASLNELLHESIVLHITHQGKLHNTTLGRANLLFRTVVKNGKSFKEGNLITFQGTLKTNTNPAQIEGTLYFKNLPRFAQMRAASVLKHAIHTEKGIIDAVPLIPGLPEPKVKIIPPEKSALDAESVSSPRPARATKNKEDKVEKEEKEPVKKTPSTTFVDNLISFSPVPTRIRSATVDHPPTLEKEASSFGQQDFDPFGIKPKEDPFSASFGKNPAPNPFAEIRPRASSLIRQGSNLALTPTPQRAKESKKSRDTTNNPFTQPIESTNPFAF